MSLISSHEDCIIRVEGTPTLLHLTAAAWFGERTPWPVRCNDGVTRCVTVPNWQWTLWERRPGPDPFGRLGQRAWFAVAARATTRATAPDPYIVFAERLARFMDEKRGRHPFGNRPTNDNRRPSTLGRARHRVRLQKFALCAIFARYAGRGDRFSQAG